MLLLFGGFHDDEERTMKAMTMKISMQNCLLLKMDTPKTVLLCLFTMRMSSVNTVARAMTSIASPMRTRVSAFRISFTKLKPMISENVYYLGNNNIVVNKRKMSMRIVTNPETFRSGISDKIRKEGSCVPQRLGT